MSSQPLIGTVAAAMMGQLEDRAVANQVGVVGHPPLSLVGLAVAGQEGAKKSPYSRRMPIELLLLSSSWLYRGAGEKP